MNEPITPPRPSFGFVIKSPSDSGTTLAITQPPLFSPQNSCRTVPRWTLTIRGPDGSEQNIEAESRDKLVREFERAEKGRTVQTFA